LAEKLVNSPPPPPPKPQKLPPPLDMGPGGHHARMMNHPKIHASLDYSVLPGYILQKPPKFTIFWGFLLKSGILCIIPTNAFGFLLYLSCWSWVTYHTLGVFSHVHSLIVHRNRRHVHASQTKNMCVFSSSTWLSKYTFIEDCNLKHSSEIGLVSSI
jgi:hypothetical protein